jgi:hypothetical protein
MQNIFPCQNTGDHQNAEPDESRSRTIDLGELITKNPQQEQKEKGTSRWSQHYPETPPA